MRVVVLLLIGLMAATGWAADPLKQFRADQIMTVSGRSMNSRLFVDGDHVRSELIMEGAGPMVSIVDGQKKVLWMLMPGNLYMEKSLASDDDVSHQAWSGDENRELIGTEKINGQVCEKYRIKGTKQEMFMYTQPKTGYPVLMETADKSLRIEWKNVQPGPQSAALFVLPAGYRKLALPSFPGGFKLPGMK